MAPDAAAAAADAADAAADAADRLAGAAWRCTATAPGAVDAPDGLGAPGLTWWAATVPGTAAGALTDAGAPDADTRDYDTSDWWFTTTVAVPEAGPHRLTIGGLATLGDVFVDGRLVLHTENMFRAATATIDLEVGSHTVALRCAALTPALAERRPRPRWKTYLVTHQNLRWFRTSLLGRIPGWAVVPAPVGPWRPLTLTPTDRPTVISRRLTATCRGEGGTISLAVTVAGRPDGPVTARAAGQSVELATVPGDDGTTTATGTIDLDRVARWWPATHGDQPRTEVELVLPDGTAQRLGAVGFRTIEVERHGGGFALSVNGQQIFCRGAVWFPPDPVHLAHRPDELSNRLVLARRAGMNMLRVPATAVYESEDFFELCDGLGLLVWHDAMFAFMDPPDDEAFEAEVAAELGAVFDGWSGHPSLAVVCGSQEVDEIAAMNGLPPTEVAVGLTDKAIAGLVNERLPGTPYIGSNPSGGPLPFVMDQGVCQYFGVGGYLRPLADARLANVRFAAECLAYATPPERPTVDWHLGGPTRANHDPQWKRGVHHDAGRSWDMEDVRAHYQRELFGTDPVMERYVDPERALDLGRATNAHLMERVFSEWRRPGSSCDGGLVLALNDLRLGAGWGVIDALGVPKAPWYALARTFAPVALLATDEGLNGLALHLVNDTAGPVGGTLTVELFARGELVVEQGSTAVEAPARGAVTLDAGSLLGGFRDITYAYRFAPPAHDVVVATWTDPQGVVLGQVVHLPLGQGRALEPDVGLAAAVRPTQRSGAGAEPPAWEVEVSTTRFAQWVALEVEGYQPADNWFHLPPGGRKVVALTPTGAPAATAPAAGGPSTTRPRGTARALNARVTARLTEGVG